MLDSSLPNFSHVENGVTALVHAPPFNCVQYSSDAGSTHDSPRQPILPNFKNNNYKMWETEELKDD